MHTTRRTLDIDLGGFQLPASFWVPQAPLGVVLSLEPGELDRLVPRGSNLLEHLHARGFAVLALGLLSAEEVSSFELAQTRRFDLEELAARTVKVIDWLFTQGVTFPLGVLATGTAVAAALLAAPRRGLGAIVSIAGRPDLVAAALPKVQTPTLFLVQGDESPGLHFSQLAADRMHCKREIRVVPGDGSLNGHSGSGTTEELARAWFEEHLAARSVQGGITTRGFARA